jgi:hypothetical protein
MLGHQQNILLSINDRQAALVDHAFCIVQEQPLNNLVGGDFDISTVDG